MKIGYMSLGCKVNLYECVAVLDSFLQAGFEEASFDDRCDVYLINTCTVTSTADAKSRKMIRRAVRRNPKAVICVMGCLAQLQPEAIKAIKGVSVFCGTSNRHLLLREALKMLAAGDRHPIDLREAYGDIKTYEEIPVDHYDCRTRGFVKIQDGCENFCSYCAIPYARGRIRSRNPENILSEIRRLSLRGMKEIVLSGINTGTYGFDRKTTLAALLGRIVHEIPGSFRIRISSLEVTEITEELTELMEEEKDRFCLHLHIPLQSGSDEILKQMQRKYDKAFYRDKINLLRIRFPLINITTDIMIGFDGETDEMFRESLEFTEEMNFGETHLFPYSPRYGTLAYRKSEKIGFQNRVDASSLKKRMKAFRKLNENRALAYRRLFLGKEVIVIVEKITEGIAYGHSGNYMEVAFPVKKARKNNSSVVIITKAGYPVSEGEEKDV